MQLRDLFDKEYHERAIARVIAKCEAHKTAREEELKTLRDQVARLTNMIIIAKGNP